MKKANAYLIMLLLALAAMARTAKDAPPPAVTAVRTNEEIKLDGQLGEKVWQTPGYSAFTQVDPNDGTEPSETDHGLGGLRRPGPLRGGLSLRFGKGEDHQPAQPPRRLRRVRLVHLLPSIPISTAAAAISSPSTRPARSATGRCRTTTGATAPGTASGRAKAALNDEGWTVEMQHPLRPAALQAPGRRRLGRQFQAHDPAQERVHHLLLEAQGGEWASSPFSPA